MNELIVKAKKTGQEYMGYVFVKVNGMHAWSEWSHIYRLNREDALKDAELIKKDLQDRNITYTYQPYK